MMFRCRAKLPAESAWFDVEASSPEEAAQNFHNYYEYRIVHAKYKNKLPDGTYETVKFARIEVEGHGDLISRIFTKGIIRRGGVKPHAQTTLSDIAKAIGWERDHQELIAPGWDLEEDWPELS